MVVRRVAEVGDDPQTTSLAAAFGNLGDVVEIADTGPFFEDDLQVAGKSRLIRARQGIRPMIKIEATSQLSVREQEAKFTLGSGRIEQLTFEGLDLVVDLRDLPVPQTTLFLCRGAEVSFRDCTITLFNAGNRKFSLFRFLDGARPNRLLLERSTIRGPIRLLAEIGSSRTEVTLDRSLVVGEATALLSVEPTEGPGRTLTLSRSLLVTSGSLMEWTGKPGPMTVRSLGSTFARIEGGPVAALLHSRSPFPGEANAWLDLSGEDNLFVGWPGWLTSPGTGGAALIRLAGLEAVRASWPRSDTTSRETPGAWPASAFREDIVPADLEPYAPELRGTLVKIATPHPRIRQWAVDQIPRLPAPEFADGLVNGSPMMGRPGMDREVRSIGQPAMPSMAVAVPIEVAPPAKSKTAPPAPTGPTPPTPTVAATAKAAMNVDVTFDVQAQPWNGDLGRFLDETVKVPGGRAIIKVRGGGVHASTPVRLPDGASVAIVGESAEGSATPMPTFTPTPDSRGRVMIEIRAGDLAIANLGFATDGAVRPRHWVRVEDGLLAIRHCKFRDIGGADPAVGATIAFFAPGSAPIPPRAGPLRSETDYPTARIMSTLIWTGGDAIVAEVGRGVVALEDSLLIGGATAISLLPGKVAREKFEADLVLDRCTISDEKNGITLGPWAGDPAGPSRPWLVWTRSCVFPRPPRDVTGAAMLLVDPMAFASGVLAWHSNGDAYEVGRFLAPSGPQPSGTPPAADLKKQWIDLWGTNHTRNDRGPDPRRIEHVVRYKLEKDRTRAGKVFPQALELDAKVPGMKGLGVEFKNLPPLPAR